MINFKKAKAASWLPLLFTYVYILELFVKSIGGKH